MAEPALSLDQLADRAADAERRQRAERALATVHPVRGFRLRTAHELIAAPKPPEWLVVGWIERGSVCQWIGSPASAKSFGALHLGLCSASGTPFFGQRVTPGPVIYFCGEGHGALARRIAAWAQHHGVSMEGVPFYVSNASFAANRVAEAEPVAAEIRRVEAAHGPVALVIFDTLARHMVGDENEAAEVAALFACVDGLLRGSAPAACLMVHHVGHQARERARGSSAFRAAVDHEALFLKDGTHVEVRCTKSKDSEEPPPLHLGLVGVSLDDWPRGEDGGPVTSAVLRPGRVPAPTESRPEPRGGNQARIVETLRTLRRENADRLAAGGVRHGVPRVRLDTLRQGKQGSECSFRALTRLSSTLRATPGHPAGHSGTLRGTLRGSHDSIA